MVGNRPGPPEGCTARRGTGGLRPSPAEEVSFLKDLSFSNLDFLIFEKRILDVGRMGRVSVIEAIEGFMYREVFY